MLLLIAHQIISNCPLMNLLTRRRILALALFAAFNAPVYRGQSPKKADP